MDTSLSLDTAVQYFTTSPLDGGISPPCNTTQVLEIPNGTLEVPSSHKSDVSETNNQLPAVPNSQILEVPGHDTQILDVPGPNTQILDIPGSSNQVLEVPNMDSVDSNSALEALMNTASIEVSPPLPQTESPVAPPSCFLCSGCQQPIRERYLLRALDVLWHEQCLKCSCCGCRLGEVGSSLYTRANLLLCKRDYLRLFGAAGQCAVCGQSIPGFEMVMRVKDAVYHQECFKCQQCRQRFSVGDKLWMCEGRVLCEYDYEEQNLITSIQRGGYSALSQLKKQGASLTSYANSH